MVVTAAIAFAYRLEFPERLYFDERHYVADARELWDHGVEAQRLAHPPLGKFLIGTGIEVVGDQPIGWRIVPLLSGVVVVACTYLATRALTGRHTTGLLAAALVASDGLIMAMSRIAMLDMIAAAHVVVAFTLLVVDRNRRDELAGDGDAAVEGPRRSQLASVVRRTVALVTLGAAVSVKWSALPALLALGIMVLWWDIRRARTTTATVSRRRLATTATLSGFAIVPAIVYIATFVPWAANYERSQTYSERCPAMACDVDASELALGWWHDQTARIEFQRKLIISHPDRTEALRWPLTIAPVMHYDHVCPATADAADCAIRPGSRARIEGLGNIVLWWSAIAASVVVAVRIVRRRPVSVWPALALALALWVPWIFSINPGFLFYMTPVVPFMAMVVAGVVGDIARADVRRGVAATLLVLTIAMAIWQYPIITGIPIAPSGVEHRLFLPQWH